MQPTAKRYYISLGGQQAGPFTIEQLRAQRVRPSTQVWDDDRWTWIPASHLEEFAELLRPRKRSANPQQHGPWRWLDRLREAIARPFRTHHETEIG